MIELNYLDIFYATALMLAIALSNRMTDKKIKKEILISTFRMIAQLLLVGLVLKSVFNSNSPTLIAAIAFVMVFAASHEIQKRQQHRLKGTAGRIVSLFAIGSGSLLMLLFSLQVVIQPEPWYEPRYLIPILGMLLGNTMNGLAISLDRLHEYAIQDRKTIEARLIIGERPQQAMEQQITTSIKSGLIPIINAMAAAGIISLPGMMTGQILGGTSPEVAVKYQIFIMLVIATSTIIAVYTGVNLSVKNLFDDRDRLRSDRLSQ